MCSNFTYLPTFLRFLTHHVVVVVVVVVVVGFPLAFFTVADFTQDMEFFQSQEAEDQSVGVLGLERCLEIH